jgi:MFS family permease
LLQVVTIKCILGLAVGGEYTAIFAAVDELIPAYVRGRVDIILDGAWLSQCKVILFRALGGAIACLLSLILHFFTGYSPTLWRFQLLAGAVGALPVLVLRKRIPESPRWLAFKGRFEEANEIVRQIILCAQNNVFIEEARHDRREVVPLTHSSFWTFMQ